MSPALYRFLRFLFIGLAIIHLGAVIVAYARKPIFRSKNLEIASFIWWSDLFMTVAIAAIGSTLAFMLKRTSYHLFLGGALILLAIGYTWTQTWERIIPSTMLAEAILTSTTGVVFIYSMLRFAGKHTTADYYNYFKSHKRPRWYKSLVVLFSKDKAFWFLLFPLFFLLALLSTLISVVISFALNIVILITGLIYFRISYNFSGKENQNRLSWLLWELISVTGLYVVELILWQFYSNLIYLRLSVYILTCLVICFSFIMCIFFSRGTDANIIVRKTLIYSALFLAGLFLFGVLEHLVIHSVAHLLHVKSSILNSCVGAAIALLIRPLHHAVEHRLNQWEKSKKQRAEKKQIALQDS